MIATVGGEGAERGTCTELSSVQVSDGGAWTAAVSSASSGGGEGETFRRKSTAQGTKVPWLDPRTVNQG